jgi:hypothetical protein
VFFASERSVERFVVLFRRVERGEDFCLEQDRSPGQLWLNFVELGALHRRRARLPAACRGGSVSLHGFRIDTHSVELRGFFNLTNLQTILDTREDETVGTHLRLVIAEEKVPDRTHMYVLDA